MMTLCGGGEIYDIYCTRPQGGGVLALLLGSCHVVCLHAVNGECWMMHITGRNSSEASLQKEFVSFSEVAVCVLLL